MRYHDRAKRAYERAKSDNRFDEIVAFKAACLTNIAIAATADDEIYRLRSALKAICGDVAWPDPDKGYVDIARDALSST